MGVNGTLDILGIAYSVEVETGDEYSGDDHGPLVDVTILVPALEPGAAAQVVHSLTGDPQALALGAWKAGYKDGLNDAGVHDEAHGAYADDYQNGWMEGEADRLNNESPNAAFAEGVVSTWAGNLIAPPLPDCWLWANGFAMSRTPDDRDVLAGYMDGGREQAWECHTLRKESRFEGAGCAVHD